MYSVLGVSNLSRLILSLTFVAQDNIGKYFKTSLIEQHPVCALGATVIDSIVFRCCLSDDTFNFALVFSYLGEKLSQEQQYIGFFHIRKEDEVFSALSTKHSKITLLIYPVQDSRPLNEKIKFYNEQNRCSM